MELGLLQLVATHLLAARAGQWALNRVTNRQKDRGTVAVEDRARGQSVKPCTAANTRRTRPPRRPNRRPQSSRQVSARPRSKAAGPQIASLTLSGTSAVATPHSSSSSSSAAISPSSDSPGRQQRQQPASQASAPAWAPPQQQQEQPHPQPHTTASQHVPVPLTWLGTAAALGTYWAGQPPARLDSLASAAAPPADKLPYGHRRADEDQPPNQHNYPHNHHQHNHHNDHNDHALRPGDPKGDSQLLDELPSFLQAAGLAETLSSGGLSSGGLSSASENGAPGTAAADLLPLGGGCLSSPSAGHRWLVPRLQALQQRQHPEVLIRAEEARERSRLTGWRLDDGGALTAEGEGAGQLGSRGGGAVGGGDGSGNPFAAVEAMASGWAAAARNFIAGGGFPGSASNPSPTASTGLDVASGQHSTPLFVGDHALGTGAPGGSRPLGAASGGDTTTAAVAAATLTSATNALVHLAEMAVEAPVRSLRKLNQAVTANVSAFLASDPGRRLTEQVTAEMSSGALMAPVYLTEELVKARLRSLVGDNWRHAAVYLAVRVSLACAALQAVKALMRRLVKRRGPRWLQACVTFACDFMLPTSFFGPLLGVTAAVLQLTGVGALLHVSGGGGGVAAAGAGDAPMQAPLATALPAMAAAATDVVSDTIANAAGALVGR